MVFIAALQMASRLVKEIKCAVVYAKEARAESVLFRTKRGVPTRSIGFDWVVVTFAATGSFLHQMGVTAS